jgi:hypothetical protein
MIASTQQALAAFDPVRQTLADGFSPDAQALQPFASHGDSVRATLGQAPPALTEVRGGLPPVTALLAQVRGSLPLRRRC